MTLADRALQAAHRADMARENERAAVRRVAADKATRRWEPLLGVTDPKEWTASEGYDGYSDFLQITIDGVDVAARGPTTNSHHVLPHSCR